MWFALLRADLLLVYLLIINIHDDVGDVNMIVFIVIYVLGIFVAIPFLMSMDIKEYGGILFKKYEYIFGALMWPFLVSAVICHIIGTLIVKYIFSGYLNKMENVAKKIVEISNDKDS